MTDKIRKRLGPVSVVATIAVLGLLAAFIALAALPETASAQPPAPPELPAPGTTPTPPPGGGGPPAPPELPAPTEQNTQTGGQPETYLIEGPDFVVQSRDDTTRYTIRVLDENGNPPDFSLSMDSENVGIRFDVLDTSDADVSEAEQCLPAGASVVDLQGNTLGVTVANNCTINLDVSSDDPGFEVMATTVADRTDMGISLLVDAGIQDTHTVRFLGPMEAPPPTPDPDIEVSTTDCYSIGGYPDENRDDLADPTIASVDAEIGQDTVQVLNGIDSVQLTVTSCQEGPVYIRFLDSNGDVFGTDVDECETCPDAAGADVVGLDSQGRLELNLMKDYTAAEALMYDQYTLISINPDTDNPMERLVGKPGQYYQGKFRFYAPCEWGPFNVQVHEPSGKVLQELQNGMMSAEVTCVPAEQAVAQPIEVVQGSRADREMIVRWQPIADAVEYTVAVLDTSDPAMFTIPYVEMFDASATRETTVTGLTSGTRYIYAVYAELPGGTYSPAEIVISTPEF